MNGEVDLVNLDVVLQWKPFTTSMIGTPCSGTIYEVASIYILLDALQDLDPSAPIPVTNIAKITTTMESFTIGTPASIP